MIENFVFLKNDFKSIVDNMQTTKQFCLENKQAILQFYITKENA